jgi:hypothetical protein
MTFAIRIGLVLVLTTYFAAAWHIYDPNWQTLPNCTLPVAGRFPDATSMMVQADGTTRQADSVFLPPVCITCVL